MVTYYYLCYYQHSICMRSAHHIVRTDRDPRRWVLRHFWAPAHLSNVGPLTGSNDGQVPIHKSMTTHARARALA